MSKLELVAESFLGGNYKLNIDGKSMEGIVHDISINMSPGTVGSFFIRGIITSCTVKADGIVYFNDQAVPDSIARQYYLTLKNRFEKDYSNRSYNVYDEDDGYND